MCFRFNLISIYLSKQKDNKMKKYLGYLAIVLSVCIVSCDKETNDGGGEDGGASTDVFGCTNEDAINYDATATVDDGSCEYNVPDVYGCTNENAINYDAAATLDNGSCEYSISYLASGDWTVSHIEYDTEIDLSIIDVSILDAISPLISTFISTIGLIPVVGEADDAGMYSISMNNTYTSDLAFTTEPISILSFEIPGVPINLPSNGSWSLQNNEEEIVFIDETTGAQQLYEITNLTEEFALLRGVLIISQEIPLLGLYEFEIELELTLEK